MQNKPARIVPNWVDKRKDVRLFGSYKQPYRAPVQQ